LIRLLLSMGGRAGLDRAAAAIRPPAGVVFTLHHVRPARAPRSFDPNAGLSITPDFLNAVLTLLIDNGWKAVPVERLFGEIVNGRGPTFAVTLDDGFRDNLEYALPVFEAHRVPFTVYVTAGFCDRTAELWWEALEEIIATNEIVRSDGFGPADAFATRTLREKQRAFSTWVGWLTRTVTEDEQRVAIRRLAAEHGVDLADLAERLVTSWDEVRSLSAHPLASIGAHTVRHPALARLPAECALGEMVESAERIERETGHRPTTIAFPYGYAAAAGEREARLAAQAGFAASFTTRPGVLLDAATRHGLPRISLNGHLQSTRATRLLAEPGLWKLRYAFSGAPAAAAASTR